MKSSNFLTTVQYKSDFITVLLHHERRCRERHHLREPLCCLLRRAENKASPSLKDIPCSQPPGSRASHVLTSVHSLCDIEDVCASLLVAAMDPREALEQLHSRPWGSVVGNKMVLRHFSKEMGGWGSSALLPYGKLQLDPLASCLHYGASVFEGMKAFRAMPGSGGSMSSASTDTEYPIVLFRPELNAQRFQHSAARQALPELPTSSFVSDVKCLVSALTDYVPEERGSSLYIRVVLFATKAALGVKRSTEAMMVVLGLPVPEYYTGPIRLLAESKYVRSWPGGCGYAKAAGNYALTVKPAEDAAARGYTQILWLFDGKVTESGVMNFFVVFRPAGSTRHVLQTPPVESGLILPGITRKSLLEIVQAEFSDCVEVRETDIDARELCTAIDDGRVVDVFGCGTAVVVTPIQSITMGENFVEHTVQRHHFSHGRYLHEILRDRLLDIQHSMSHPWTTSV